MCYEYDDLYERARLAEQFRKQIADDVAKQGKAPAKPAETEKDVKEQPVPA